jgi:hypothetical protein
VLPFRVLGEAGDDGVPRAVVRLDVGQRRLRLLAARGAVCGGSLLLSSSSSSFCTMLTLPRFQ